jgi:toxin ParE1/3/4
VPRSKISRSPLAKRDLIDIFVAIAIHNRPAARRIVRRLDHRISLLADYPELGPKHPDIVEELRMLVEGNYLILYRVHPGIVEIVRVLHGARDLSSLF